MLTERAPDGTDRSSEVCGCGGDATLHLQSYFAFLECLGRNLFSGGIRYFLIYYLYLVILLRMSAEHCRGVTKIGLNVLRSFVLS